MSFEIGGLRKTLVYGFNTLINYKRGAGTHLAVSDITPDYVQFPVRVGILKVRNLYNDGPCTY
jgi:hypothetical protein